MAAAGAIKAGAAYVELYGDNSKLNTALKNSEANVRSWAGTVVSIGKTVVAAVTAIAIPLAATVAWFKKAGSELFILSKSTGLSVETLSELKVAADVSGAALADVAEAAKELNRNISGGGLQEGLREIGVDFAAISKMNAGEQFGAVAEGLAKIKDPADRSMASVRLLGDQAKAVFPYLESIAKFRGEAVRLGLTISKEDAQNANEMAEASNLLWATLQKFVFGIGAEVAQIIKQFAEWAGKAAKSAREWITANSELFITLVKIAGIAGAAFVTFYALKAVAGGLSILTTGAGAAGAAVQATTTATGLLSGVIGSFFGILRTTVAFINGGVLVVFGLLKGIAIVVGATFTALGASVALINLAFRILGITLAVLILPFRAIWFAWKNWETISAIAGKIGDFVVTSLTKMGDAIVTVATAFIKGTASIIQGLVGLAPAFTSVISGVASFGAGMLGLIPILLNPITLILAAGAALFYFASGLFAAKKEMPKGEAAPAAPGFLAGKVGVVKEYGTAAVTALANAIGSIHDQGRKAGGVLDWMTGKFGDLKKAGGNAIDWVKSRFEEVKVDAMNAYEAIKSALTAGDISGAIKIGWAAAKPYLIELYGWMREKWADLKEFIFTLWIDVSAWAVEKINAAWPLIVDGFQTMGETLKEIWFDVMDYIGGLWNSFMVNVAGKLTALLPTGVGVLSQIVILNQAGIAKADRGGLKTEQEKLDEAARNITMRNATPLINVQRDNAAEIAAIKEAGAKERKSIQDETSRDLSLAKAKRDDILELENFFIENAEQIKAAKEAVKAKRDKDSPTNFLKDTIGAVGTFSAGAIGGMGADLPAIKMNTAKAATGIQEIIRRLEIGQMNKGDALVFGGGR